MNLGKNGITAPHYNAGLDDEMPSSHRGSVFLDIPFYRTGFSVTGNRQKPVSENPTFQDLPGGTPHCAVSQTILEIPYGAAPVVFISVGIGFADLQLGATSKRAPNYINPSV